MTDYSKVLAHLYPAAEWSLMDNDLDTLVWYSDGEAPAADELDAAWPAVDAALAWNELRFERDRLLAASDWTQVSDAPVDAAAWAVYRQQLRDVPQDFASPDDVVWPTPPV